MQAYTVTGKHVMINGGLLKLTEEQADARRYALQSTRIEGVFKVLKATHFKCGETFGYDGPELGKSALMNMAPAEERKAGIPELTSEILSHFFGFNPQTPIQKAPPPALNPTSRPRLKVDIGPEVEQAQSLLDSLKAPKKPAMEAETASPENIPEGDFMTAKEVATRLGLVLNDATALLAEYGFTGVAWNARVPMELAQQVIGEYEASEPVGDGPDDKTPPPLE